MATETTTNPLELSDEDFLKQATSLENAAEETPNAGTTDNDQGAQVGSGSEAVVEPSKEQPEDTSAKETQTEVVEEEAGKEAVTPEVTPEAGKDKPVEGETDKETGVDDKDKQPETPVVEVNYEENYKKIMAPFKANGRTIELRDPEEAIKLMQMGANYTKRMQELTPHRKTLMMLESNGIDQDKLSYLIDLDKKNPEAIKKLVKDSGIDPMDLDASEGHAYVPGNHRVSDEAVNFNTTLDELASDQAGRETLSTIQTWDDASKDVLWKNPEIMQVMHQQRELGVYDKIVDEVERRRTLGVIPPNMPFLEAYKTVGDDLIAYANRNGQSGQESGTTGATSTAGHVVATRAATPKPAVEENDRAAAASTSRTTPKAAVETQNPLSMSDEEFLKQMSGRV